MTFVLVGTPVGGGVVSHDYLHGVLDVQRRFAELGWGIEIVTIADGLVTRSRTRSPAPSCATPTSPTC